MKLEKGKKAATKEGMKHNVKVMEHAGYSKKRAEGTAYGEVGMEKKARKHESEALKKEHRELHKHHKKEADHHEKMAKMHHEKAKKDCM